MSEYQYHEFRAIDRPLTAAEMQKLRSCSTRARITRTSFVNEYHWGDLKADPVKWVAQYFDAYLYLANWGTRELALRLPSSVLSPTTARRYASGGMARVEGKKGATMLWLAAEELQDWDEEEWRLASFVPLRAELARGDLRPLYLAWLLNVHYHAVEDDAVEPPVPPGLDQLSEVQEELVDFFQLDPDLVQAAARTSPAALARPGRASVRRELSKWPAKDKDELLVRLAQGADSVQLRAELMSRLAARRSGAKGRTRSESAAGTRTAAELRAAAESIRARLRGAAVR